jgi:hypothetical protein
LADRRRLLNFFRIGRSPKRGRRIPSQRAPSNKFAIGTADLDLFV